MCMHERMRIAHACDACVCMCTDDVQFKDGREGECGVERAVRGRALALGGPHHSIPRRPARAVENHLRVDICMRIQAGPTSGACEREGVQQDKTCMRTERRQLWQELLRIQFFSHRKKKELR